MSRDRPWILIVSMALIALTVALAILMMDRGFRNSFLDLFGYGGPHSDEPSGNRDLFHTGANIRGQRNGESYAAYDARRDQSSSEGFQGFGCVGSCTDLELGYRWAQSNRITDAKECEGSSWSILEGCVAYVTKGQRIEP